MLGRGPTPVATESLPAPTLAPLPPPERLPTGAAFRAAARPATAVREPRALVELAIDTAAPEWLLANGGIGLFQADTGANFQWLPLSAAQLRADGQRTVAQVREGSQLTITLAADRQFARHGYLLRREVAVTPSTGEVALLDPIVAVRFDLPQGVADAGPLQLTRIDDPMWLPMQHGAGLALTAGSILEIPLGAGSYELREPIGPAPSQRFQVPPTQVVEVDRALTGVRGGQR